MIRDILTIGDKIELRKIINEKNSHSNNIYISQLLELVDEDILIIALPISKGRLIPLSIGETYSCCFYASKGLYQCNITILDRAKTENLHILKVQVLSELEKVQRRQFYRIDCILDTKYRLVTEQEMALKSKLQKNDFSDSIERENCLKTLDEIKSTTVLGNIIDISGGGARFVSEEILKKDDRMTLEFDLSIGGILKKLTLEAIVLSSTKVINKSGFYEQRIKFVDLLKEERETIIKFIFEEERRQRKKEKGLKM